jgi:hypothetical protein
LCGSRTHLSADSPHAGCTRCASARSGGLRDTHPRPQIPLQTRDGQEHVHGLCNFCCVISSHVGRLVMRRPSERTAFADISTLATGLLWGDRVDQQSWVCPQCARALSPEDTLLFSRGLLSHLDCRRPRVLSAEERALLFTYCRDHHVAECVRCAGKFHLREIASRDSFGILTHRCPWCHTDLTDSIRAHLYDCAMLPAAVRSRAQAAREAAQSLVKRSHQLSDAADVLLREAEAALYALRATMRQAPISGATRETEHPAA